MRKLKKKYIYIYGRYIVISKCVIKEHIESNKLIFTTKKKQFTRDSSLR